MPHERDVVVHIHAACLLRGLARRLPLRCGLLLAFRLAAEHLHFVGANLSAVLLLAVLVGPFPRAQRTLDIDLTALAQILTGDLGQLAVEVDAVPLGRLLALAGLPVFPRLRSGDSDIADRVARRGETAFRVGAEIAHNDYLVH